MCLGALRGEHSLKVAHGAHTGQRFPPIFGPFVEVCCSILGFLLSFLCIRDMKYLNWYLFSPIFTCLYPFSPTPMLQCGPFSWGEGEYINTPSVYWAKSPLRGAVGSSVGASVVYPPFFGSRSRSIPQGMILDVQTLIESLFCRIKRNLRDFLILRPLSPEIGYHILRGDGGGGQKFVYNKAKGQPALPAICRPGIKPPIRLLAVCWC